MSEADHQNTNFAWPDPLIESILSALAAVEDPHGLSSAVKKAAGEEPPVFVQSLIDGLAYMLNRDPEDERGQYLPMIEWSDGATYPRPLADATDSDHSAWADALLLFGSNPVVRARLNDLLWCVRYQPRPDQRARAANAAMRELWGVEGLEDIETADLLARSLAIARELNHGDLLAETAAALLNAIDDALNSVEWAPGVPLTMIESLAALKPDDQPVELDSLIGRARTKYAADPFISDSVLRLQMARAANPRDRAVVACQAVNVWRREAKNRGGFVGVSFLEKALDLAAREGLTDIAHELRTELQIPRTAEEMGMEAISVDVPLDHDEWEGFIDGLVGTTDGRLTLRRLAAHCPVVESDEEEQATRDYMSQFPLQVLFNGVVTNRDGLPIVHVVSDDQKFEHVQFRNRGFAINLWSVVTANVIHQAHQRGVLEPENFREFVQTELIDADTADGLTRAFEHYLADRFEEATLMILHRIEKILRNAARSVGLAVYEEPSLDGARVGKYKGMGKLLHELRGWVPEANRQYLVTLLTEPRGHNLRNEALHGLRAELGAGDAALAIHAALLLATWGQSQAHPEEDANA